MKPFFVGMAWLVVLAAIATSSYVIKNQVIFLEKEIIKTNRQIKNDEREIHSLKAELSNLKDPARIEKLIKKHSDLEPIKAEKYISINSIPFKGKGGEP